MILAQASLGAWVIWSNKAADVATAHVVLGALSLVTGTLASIITLRRFYPSGATKPVVAFDEVRAGVLSSPTANP
jgi:cytochrome c oxidase assembly protein subunit 15